MRLVVIESLTKYAQLGLDRTAAGVIVATEPLSARLDEVREHLGTNIADVAVEQLPLPDRARLERRLARIGRNARIVAATLDERVRGADLPLVVAHPRAGGALIAISPTVPQPTTDLLSRLVKSAIATAAERGIDLCEGSSFGFATTRLYLTATTTRYGTPFLRVAVGTEDAGAITDVAAAIADAMEAVA